MAEQISVEGGEAPADLFGRIENVRKGVFARLDGIGKKMESLAQEVDLAKQEVEILKREIENIKNILIMRNDVELQKVG